MVEYFIKKGKDEDVKYFKKIGVSGTVLNGKGLLSLLFPNDLYINEEDLKINRGVIYDGMSYKKYLSSTESSLIKILYKEYGVENMCHFFE